MRGTLRSSCGAALMCTGVLLLGVILLPPACWLFALGIAMVLIGHTMVNKHRR